MKNTDLRRIHCRWEKQAKDDIKEREEGQYEDKSTETYFPEENQCSRRINKGNNAVTGGTTEENGLQLLSTKYDS